MAKYYFGFTKYSGVSHPQLLKTFLITAIPVKYRRKKKNMDLLNELGNDLALAFLVEKRHTEKIDSHAAQALIARVKKALQPISRERESKKRISIAKKDAAASY